MKRRCLVAALVLFGGCRDRAVECVEVAPIPMPAAPLTLRAWCEAYFQIQPAVAVQCLGGDEAEWRRRNPSSSAACDRYDDFAGDFDFDPAAAERCLAADVAEPCARHDCDGMLVPRRTLSEGQACPDGGCMDGLACTYVDSPDQCPICVPFAGRPLGAWCDLDGRCDEGECLSGRCLSVVHDGETCNSQGTPCAEGLYCDAKTCKPLLREGEPCTPLGYRDQCVPGLRCDPIDQLCRRPECSAGRVGDDCDPAEQECLLGLHCSVDDVCALPPIVGEVCGRIGPTDVPCEGSYCDAPKNGRGQCQPRKPDGAPCGDRFECESYECASGVCTSTPRPPPPPELCGG